MAAALAEREAQMQAGLVLLECVRVTARHFPELRAILDLGGTGVWGRRMTACTHCGWDEGDVLVVTASIKGRDVEVSRQGSEDWYIRVWEADGTYAYDGYWHDSSAKTADEVIAEARSGACVDEDDV